MSSTRSTNDRRRRVLYAAHHDDSGSSTAASRREVERLREARRPTAIYGERVQRRLQSRWFSVVPIGRRTFISVASAIMGLTVLLVLLHYLSVTWPRLAYAPDVSRPLRLDRADSFGRWYLSMLLAASSGAAFLTYQLRRYRLDDYRGQYRLWRTMLLVLAFASVGVAVSLVQWTGSLIDAALGQRAALAGADWVRLLISMGGMVLVLRLIAETYRSRFSLVALLVAVAAFVFPEAAGWNLFVIDSPIKWSAITSAPLIGCTALFLSLAAYLRLLYREVCEIESGPSLREQLSNLKLFAARSDLEDPVADEEEAKPKKAAKPAVAEKEEPAAPAEPKTRWWHRRKKQSEDSEVDESAAEQPKVERQQKTKPSEPAAVEESDEESPPAEEPKKRRFGLGGFSKRKPSEEAEEEETIAAESAVDESSNESASSQNSTPQPSSSGASSEDHIDPDTIDWDSLSKTERRRLRKQVKRQNRAA
ncbi:hypothetical protein LF1_26470 [Rubripirellula obstinata]|uniref:Uncharacterized protein n=1 Tax=Rubripirellula obstinata TaxID=406547 RepID=A0A5B1CFY4_9BACT|nr:hypothetical protein [Rubripirellula obstinata]KAA1260108.1 hypothetical protein LF1_26470 [Rubripirellula obstinata]